MQPLAIAAAFGFLGMFSMVGALMVVMSSRRILKLAGTPPPLMVRVILPVNTFVLAVGLLVLTLGVRGIYRLIWVA